MKLHKNKNVSYFCDGGSENVHRASNNQNYWPDWTRIFESWVEVMRLLSFTLMPSEMCDMNIVYNKSH